MGETIDELVLVIEDRLRRRQGNIIIPAFAPPAAPPRPPECTVVTIGCQAAGTVGRRLMDGDERVRLFDEEFRARASIHTIGGLSAHAAQAALLNWL